MEEPQSRDLLIGGAFIGTSFLPVFRSGGRTGLTFWKWVINHTVFGPPVEYVPEEDYARELEGVEMPKQLLLENPISSHNPIAVATGAYTDIFQIIAPDSAVAGQMVDVEVRVRNISSVTHLITVTGLVNGNDLHFGNDTKYIAPYETKSFYDSFLMPNKDVRLHAWSHWYLSPDWIDDDYAYKDIGLSAVEWVQLDRRTITLTPEVAEWVKLATRTITLTPEVPPPIEWVKLATRTITLTPEEVPPPPEWVKLDTRFITLTPPEVPPVYTCPYCGATFDTEEELLAHIAAEHPEVPPPAPPAIPTVAIILGILGIALVGVGAAAK